jgi:hypothetical protein
MLSRTKDHSAAGKIRSIEKSTDLIGKRTREHPACSIVPQPPTLPRARSYVYIYRLFRAQADWTWTHTSHKDTEQSTIEASITFDGVTLTDHRMNDLQFAGRYQCLPIRCSECLISLQNEHSIRGISHINVNLSHGSLTQQCVPHMVYVLLHIRYTQLKK